MDERKEERKGERKGRWVIEVGRQSERMLCKVVKRQKKKIDDIGSNNEGRKIRDRDREEGVGRKGKRGSLVDERQKDGYLLRIESDKERKGGRGRGKRCQRQKEKDRRNIGGKEIMEGR